VIKIDPVLPGRGMRVPRLTTLAEEHVVRAEDPAVLSR
jgi:hypothetical protein